MAQTLKFGKGTWATKTGSSMAYNDQNGNYKPLPFNVERDSIATRVNKEGLIEVVGHDKLRIDYTDSDKGVALLENSSTNLVTYSEDFTQSVWTKTNGTVSSNQAISPDGTNNSTLYTSTNSSNRLEINFSSPSTIRTFSIYIKSFNNNHVKGRITFSGLNDFNFTSTNEWQRISTTRDVSGDTFKCSLRLTNSDDSILVFGAMLEEQSFSTSYIPTSGSAVTRAADVANNAGNSEVFSDTQGVLFANIAALANDGTFKLTSISDGSTSNRITLGYSNTDNKLYIQVHSGGVAQVNFSYSIANSLLYSKLALSYKLNNVIIWVNGIKGTSDTSANMPNGLSEFNFNYTNNLPFYGKTKEIGYYDEILTDSELEYLTSYRTLSELVKELNLNTL